MAAEFQEAKPIKLFGVEEKTTIEQAERVLDRAIKAIMSRDDIDYGEALDALVKERPGLLAAYERTRSEAALEQATAEAPLTRPEDVADYL